MKKMLCLLFISNLLFCSCLEKSAPLPELVLPDKDLKEIIIRGGYWPENQGRVKAIEEAYRRRGFLKEWESFEEKHPEALRAGDERFSHFWMAYCYTETKNKKPIFNRRFKVRLYNREGKLLTEDFLRLESPKNSDDDVFSIIIYLPYHEEGYKIRIVKLQGKREIIISGQNIPFLPYEELVKRTFPPYARRGYKFNEESQCHVAPPIE